MGKRSKSDQIPHRPGPLVQTNKKHKHGKHRSKGIIEAEARGRVSVSTITKKFKNTLPKAARRKQAAVTRNLKIQQVMDEKRKLGGMRGAPINISVIPLSSSCDARLTVQYMVDGSKSFSDFLGTCGNTTHMKLSNGKNMTFLLPEKNDLWTYLDIMKLSDICLFILPVLEPLSDEAKTLLKCAKDQGMVTPFLGVTTDFSKTEEKAFLKSITKFLPVDKIYPVVNPGQISNLLRMLTVSKVTIPKQFSMRSGMIIEDCQVLQANQNTVNDILPHYHKIQSGGDDNVLLQVTGYVRKRNLNPYNPVHITGAGTYQILRIDVNPIKDVGQKQMEDGIVAPPPRFMFDPDNIPDEFKENEELQNNQDNDNVSMASDDLSDSDDYSDMEDEEEQKVKKRLPKGTSDYQADWLENSDSEKSGNIFSDDEELESGESEAEESGEEDEMDWDEDEEKKELALSKAARDEAEFPDWIDTPMDQEAKIRFQRYRGLESFKSSTWNPYENLPKEYAQLFQFQNYRHSHKKVMKETLDDGFGFIPVGQRVNLILRPIGKDSASHIPHAGHSPFISLFSLLRHETHTSVINLHLNATEILKNKEPLLLQVGFHRFQAKPILSDVNPGNKHKMLRFGQQNASCVATVIGPIVFPVASVLAFKGSNMNLVHVASGSVSSIDPSRIIVKRVILSGAPFRCNGRKATVRFMFFNRQDIEWFKPVELKTRYGRRGHIKEPLGTHGHMKCVFDGQLKSQDTILMPLYKRVFPKFTYDEYVPPYSVFD